MQISGRGMARALYVLVAAIGSASFWFSRCSDSNVAIENERERPRSVKPECQVRGVSVGPASSRGGRAAVREQLKVDAASSLQFVSSLDKESIANVEYVIEQGDRTISAGKADDDGRVRIPSDCSGSLLVRVLLGDEWEQQFTWKLDEIRKGDEAVFEVRELSPAFVEVPGLTDVEIEMGVARLHYRRYSAPPGVVIVVGEPPVRSAESTLRARKVELRLPHGTVAVVRVESPGQVVSSDEQLVRPSEKLVFRLKRKKVHLVRFVPESSGITKCLLVQGRLQNGQWIHDGHESDSFPVFGNRSFVPLPKVGSYRFVGVGPHHYGESRTVVHSDQSKAVIPIEVPVRQTEDLVVSAVGAEEEKFNLWLVDSDLDSITRYPRVNRKDGFGSVLRLADNAFSIKDLRRPTEIVFAAPYRYEFYYRRVRPSVRELSVRRSSPQREIFLAGKQWAGSRIQGVVGTSVRIQRQVDLGGQQVWLTCQTYLCPYEGQKVELDESGFWKIPAGKGMVYRVVILKGSRKLWVSPMMRHRGK